MAKFQTHIQQFIEKFLTYFGFPEYKDYSDVIFFVLISLFGSSIPFLLKGLKKLYSYYRNFKLKRDLEPFYNRFEISNAMDYYVPTKWQNVPPSKELEPIQTYTIAAQAKCMPFFLNKANWEMGKKQSGGEISLPSNSVQIKINENEFIGIKIDYFPEHAMSRFNFHRQVKSIKEVIVAGERSKHDFEKAKEIISDLID